MNYDCPLTFAEPFLCPRTCHFARWREDVSAYVCTECPRDE